MEREMIKKSFEERISDYKLSLFYYCHSFGSLLHYTGLTSQCPLGDSALRVGGLSTGEEGQWPKSPRPFVRGPGIMRLDLVFSGEPPVS